MDKFFPAVCYIRLVIACHLKFQSNKPYCSAVMWIWYDALLLDYDMFACIERVRDQPGPAEGGGPGIPSGASFLSSLEILTFFQN